MIFELLGDAGANADLLNSTLKWEILAWVAGIIVSLFWVVRQLVALWDRFRYGLSLTTGNYVTHTEFKPLVKRVENLETDVRELTKTLNMSFQDLLGEVREIKGVLKGKGDLLL